MCLTLHTPRRSTYNIHSVMRVDTLHSFPIPALTIYSDPCNSTLNHDTSGPILNCKAVNSWVPSGCGDVAANTTSRLQRPLLQHTSTVHRNQLGPSGTGKYQQSNHNQTAMVSQSYSSTARAGGKPSTQSETTPNFHDPTFDPADFLNETLSPLNGQVNHNTLAFIRRANIALDKWWSDCDELHRKRERLFYPRLFYPVFLAETF